MTTEEWVAVCGFAVPSLLAVVVILVVAHALLGDRR